MGNERKMPNHKQKARLIQETGGICAFCAFNDAGFLEFHHIDDNRANTVLENLIAVCPTCHAKITAKEITDISVINRKKELLKPLKMENKPEQTNYNIYSEGINNSILGNNNNVKVTIKKQVIKKDKYSIGDLGADTQKANYISHLITRYHVYKENEIGKQNMNYRIFQASLKKEFKIGTTRTLYNLPVERFEELAQLIQKRINATVFAKRLGKGHKNYSTFEEYLEQQM